MAIETGSKLPEATLHTMQDGKPTPVTTNDLFAGKKVAMFAVPGAFTPTCSMAHLPGYVVQADALKAKGVDSIVCLSVNDAFVMDAWGKSANAEHLMMLADGNATFTQDLGLVLDGSGFGMGTRSLRFAMIVEDGVVTLLNVDAATLDASSAEAVLAAL